MSIFFTRGTQRRQADTWPTRASVGGGSFLASVTQDTAAQVVAYDAGVNLLADTLSCLPFGAYTGRGADMREARAPGWLDDPGGAGYGLEDWVKQWVYSAGYTGNIILTVEARTGNGQPDVVFVRDPDTVRWHNGWIIGGHRYDHRDVIHVRRYPTRPGTRFCTSPIERHATTLGTALSSGRFGRQWFEDGAHPQSTLESDEYLDEEEVARIRARIIDPARGSRDPAILGGGLKLKAWQVSPEESQFLQTQGFTSAQSCRILGPAIAELLGYPTGDSSTYKNRQELDLAYLKYCVDAWLVPLERTLSRMNNPGKPTYAGGYILADRSAILRTDLLTRFQAYRTALGTAEPFMTANEARLNEQDLPPLPWGDEKPTIQGDRQNTPTQTTTTGGL